MRDIAMVAVKYSVKLHSLMRYCLNKLKRNYAHVRYYLGSDDISFIVFLFACLSVCDTLKTAFLAVFSGTRWLIVVDPKGLHFVSHFAGFILSGMAPKGTWCNICISLHCCANTEFSRFVMQLENLTWLYFHLCHPAIFNIHDIALMSVEMSKNV